MEKNWGDTPSATLIYVACQLYNYFVCRHEYVALQHNSCMLT